ncbi:MULTISPECIES: four helix bundle protein [Sphingobacterium]|uniref:four helix bundle protein n=1 Tax=Sphingobacterium TaxID=28453 RepID=UPI0013DC8731|nr:MULTISPECIES: four helix bundle protein [unclassified Sphingobacterium]
MKTHKDLDVWNKSMELVTAIYQLTKYFPKEETYGLTNQIRRSAVSVPSNIAEGAARKHNKEYIQFLYIALGSASELETQLLIAKNLNYYNEEQSTLLLDRNDRVRKMLVGLIKSVQNRNAKPVTRHQSLT